MTKFKLPPVIAELVLARNRVRNHYNVPGLAFTLDGKLVGDIGEAVAAEMYDLTLTPGGGTAMRPTAALSRSKLRARDAAPFFAGLRPEPTI